MRQQPRFLREFYFPVHNPTLRDARAFSPASNRRKCVFLRNAVSQKHGDFSGVEPEKSLGLSLLLPRSLLCGLRALGRFRRHRTAEIARLRETEFHANAWGKLFVFRNAKCVSPQTPLRFWACIGAAAPSGRASRSSPRLRREWSLRSSASGGLKPFSEEKG